MIEGRLRIEEKKPNVIKFQSFHQFRILPCLLLIFFGVCPRRRQQRVKKCDQIFFGQKIPFEENGFAFRNVCNFTRKLRWRLKNYSASSRHVRFIFIFHCKNDLVTRDQRHVISLFTSFHFATSLSGTLNFLLLCWRSHKHCVFFLFIFRTKNRRSVLISSVRRKKK